MTEKNIMVGVLALQGDFDAHRRRLEELGATVVLVRNAEQLDDIDALVIPGGESTTFLRLLGDKFMAKLQDFGRVKPTFGTCAGAILLSNEVQNPPQPSLAVLDAVVQRNAYGRQIDSSIRKVSTSLPGGPLEAVFIRAPKFNRVGPNVEVLARDGDTPIMLRQGNILAATFHPELSPDPRAHQFFLALVVSSGNGCADDRGAART